MVSWLRDIASFLRSTLTFDTRTLSADERQAVERSMDDFSEKGALVYMLGAGIYLITGMPLIPFTMSPSSATFAFVMHAVFFAAIAFVGLLKGKYKARIAPIVLVGQWLGVTIFAGFCFYVMSSRSSLDRQWLTLLGYLCIVGIAILGIPAGGRLWKWLTVYYTAVSFVAVLPSHNPFFAAAAVLTIICMSFAVRAIFALLIKKQALNEHRIREVMKKAEREKYDHELELARRIQNSLAPSNDTLISNDLTITMRQFRHFQVGGDWCNFRNLADDRVVVVVTDATGKGMQAALVLHAVQSLWADSLKNPRFDVPKWIHRVNHTLVNMGAGSPHTVTMGVLEVFSNKLIYWSAAHVPLFVQTEPFLETDVTCLLGQGSMLGISEDLALKPAVFPLDTTQDFRLLMASDGMLRQGTVYSRAELKRLMDRASHDEAKELLSELPDDDDKTLVWVTRTVNKARVA